jgi:hypothetical protein
MTFICKEDLEAMLRKEMNIAHTLAYSEGIIDNQGNYLSGCDLHRSLSKMEYDTLKIVYEFIQNMESI